MAGTATESPVRPARLSVAAEQTSEGLVLSRRNAEWGAGIFMLLWLIGWTVGCVALAVMVRKEPTLFHLLFAVPFWASWIFVFVMVLKSFLQRDRLVLNDNGVLFQRRVLVVIQERFVHFDEVREFGTYCLADSENGHREGLELTTWGQPLRLFDGLSVEEITWLRHSLNEMLSKLRDHRDNGDEDGQTAVNSESVQAWRAEQLAAADREFRPPTDSRWQRADSAGSVMFLQRGRLAWSELFGLLFLNAFWNGVVGVFILDLFGGAPQLDGLGWWGLFVFLIPFEAIGLMLAVGLLFAIIEPLRRSCWDFRDGTIVHYTKWCGLGPVRRYDFDRLQRVELRTRKDESESGSFEKMPAQFMLQDEEPFVLTFVNRHNVEICSISSLTEGEARWMADVVLREQPDWFK